LGATEGTAVGEAARVPLDAATVPAVQPIARAATATTRKPASTDFEGRENVECGFMVVLL
jgi:hypothetical protein